MSERGSDFFKVTRPVSDRHQPPHTLSCVLSSLRPISWTPTSHVCKAPFPGPRPVSYSIPFWGVVELSVEEKAILLWPGVLGGRSEFCSEAWAEVHLCPKCRHRQGKVGRQPGVQGGGPKEGGDGCGPEAAEPAPPTFLVSNGSHMVTRSLQFSLVSRAPMPSPPPQVPEEVTCLYVLLAHHCLPFIL